jgi:hypothetical protein
MRNMVQIDAASAGPFAPADDPLDGSGTIPPEALLALTALGRQMLALACEEDDG